MATEPANTEERILDLAEHLIRENGFNGFSFRDLASGIGVKSSSIHYHFPTKAELGRRVAERYTDRFLDQLGPSEEASADADAVLESIRHAFELALTRDGQMCLCGVLGAESSGLPEPVALATRRFFERVSGWLIDALKRTDWGNQQTDRAIEETATRTLALLEGGLLLARARGQTSVFDAIRPERLAG